MENDSTIFKESEVKDTTLTLRLTARQKNSIYELAQQKNLSMTRYILDLVGVDHKRLLKELKTAI